MKYKIILLTGILLIAFGLVYTKSYSNKNTSSSFSMNQLDHLGEVYYILYDGYNETNKLVLRTGNGDMIELSSSYPHFNEVKYSPDYRYISWVDGTSLQLNIYDRRLQDTSVLSTAVYQHTWNPKSSALLTMSPDCPLGDFGSTQIVKLIATKPGISTYMFDTVNIDSPHITNHIGCFNLTPGSIGQSKMGWFDNQTVWIEAYDGLYVVDVNTGNTKVYSYKPQHSHIYSPFNGGNNYQFNRGNLTSDMSQINTNQQDSSSLFDQIETNLFEDYAYTPIKTDFLNNLYYFHNNCVYRMDIHSLQSVELSCRPELNYFPDIMTTLDNNTIISYGYESEFYYCSRDSCNQFSIEFDNPEIYVSKMFMLPFPQ